MMPPVRNNAQQGRKREGWEPTREDVRVQQEQLERIKRIREVIIVNARAHRQPNGNAERRARSVEIRRMPLS